MENEKWDGVTWVYLDMTSLMEVTTNRLAFSLNGTLYARYGTGINDPDSIFYWDGAKWTDMGVGITWIYSLAISPTDGTLYVGDNYPAGEGKGANRVVK